MVVLNNIGLTSQIPLKSATSDFGPTFQSAICKLENRRQAQEGFSLWIPSLPAREESSSALTGAWEGTVWAAVRHKGGPKPSCQPVLLCQGLWGDAKLCVPCLSSSDLNFVLLSPEQILFQMPSSAFSSLFRGIEKPSRLSD